MECSSTTPAFVFLSMSFFMLSFFVIYVLSFGYYVWTS